MALPGYAYIEKLKLMYIPYMAAIHTFFLSNFVRHEIDLHFIALCFIALLAVHCINRSSLQFSKPGTLLGANSIDVCSSPNSNIVCDFQSRELCYVQTQ